MIPAQDLTDAEIGELDDLLAAVPPPFEPLDVVLLDGYLCGVLAQPVPLDESAWLPPALDLEYEAGRSVLGPDTPGWHEAKHERLLGLIRKRVAALERALREDGWFDPLIMTPEDEEGRPLSGPAAIEAALAPWVVGFEHAMSQFPALEDAGDSDVPDLLDCLWRHLPDKTEEEEAYARALDEEHPLSSLDAAIEDLVENVVSLADIGRRERLKVATIRRDAPKVGRNDPCPCGSGRKYKNCHGR